jgi:glyoxylase-like metal-dependent hydrolase (beta-lactamase superfamily II)
VTPIAFLVAALVAVPVAAQEPEFTGDQVYETTEVADGVYRFRHLFHNTLFIVTPDGVVAFDPLNPVAAGHLAEEIQRLAPGKELLALVYSHDHGDHVSGGPTLFAALGEAPIIAHENAYEKVSAAEDAARPVPGVTLTDRVVLRPGGRAIELHYVGKTHSDNMLVAYIPDVKLAFAVDFVSHDAVGYRTLPDWHYPELYAAIERLQQIPFETIVFGHGPVGDRSSVDRQLQYYRDLRDAVQEAIDAGASKEEAVERVDIADYRDWQWYDEWFSMNVDKMYDWLTALDDQ